MTMSIHFVATDSIAPAARFDRSVETMRLNLVPQKARTNRPFTFNFSRALHLVIGMIAIAMMTTLSPRLLAAQPQLPLTPPNPPTITAVVPQQFALDVYWNPPVIDGNNAPTHYIIDWHPGYQTEPIIFPDQHNARAIDDLVPGTTYTFRIIAVNDAGKSYSAPVDGVPLPGPTVSSVQVDEATITQTTADVNVTLQNLDSQTLDVYLRYRAITQSRSSTWIDAPAITTNGTTASFSLSGLSPASIYEIRASLDHTFNRNVAEDTLITPGPPEKPILTLVPGDGFLTAHWATFLNGGTPSSYLLEWKPSSDPTFANSAIPPVADSTFVISGLTNDQLYDARLTIVTDLGSATSEVISVAPAVRPVVSKIELVKLTDTRSTEVYTSSNLDTASLPVRMFLRTLPRRGKIRGPYAEDIPTDRPSRSDNFSTRLEGDREFILQAVLIQGDETPDWDLSAQIMFKTQPNVPWRLDEPEIISGDREFTISWLQPLHDGGSPVDGYAVWWRTSSEAAFTTDRVVVVGPNARSATVTGLENGVQYIVGVQPNNEHGGPGSADLMATIPSTVPQIAPRFDYATPCDRRIVLGWISPAFSGGSRVDEFTIQWRRIDQPYYSTDRQVNVDGIYRNGSVFRLEPDTEFVFRIRANNANGPAHSLVTNPADGTTTTVPLWSDEFSVTTRGGQCSIGPRFGNTLADSIPFVFHFYPLDTVTHIFVRHREFGTPTWYEIQHHVIQPGQSSVNVDLTGLNPDTRYEIETSSHRSFPVNDRWRFFIRTQSAPSTTFISGSRARVLRIEPTISSVYLSPGDSINLAVNIYGRQNILDNDLADLSPEHGGPVFHWQASPALIFTETDTNSARRNNAPDDREVRVTAPETPGTHTITVGFTNPNMCLGTRPDETDQQQTARCSATFQLTVTRSSIIDLPELPPFNPSGSVPQTLTDAQGTAYAVFTPLEGGIFTDEGIELSAAPGTIASNEFIAISVTREGEANNAGQTHHRYTLAGHTYAVNALDANSNPITNYFLNKPATPSAYPCLINSAPA